MKACNKCGIEKEETQFSFRNKSKKIRHKQCKVCLQINIKRHYLNNKEIYLKRVSDWVNNNRDKRAKNAHNSYALNRGYIECECCTREEINEFISNRPEGCHVDHIQTVRQGGKHCLKNLQYLGISEHCRKSAYERL